MSRSDHIPFLVSRLNDCAQRFLAAELRQAGIAGIEPAHGAILRLLHGHGPLSMGRLAALTGRTRPTVTVLVQKLVRHGYVSRETDPADGRAVVVRLTDRALGLAEEMEAISVRLRRTLFRSFSRGERVILAELLEKGIANFESA